MYNIQRVLKEINKDDTAEYMAQLLMDDSNSTYKMFEQMASEYLNGNDDFCEGFNRACAILTGWYMESIAEQILDEYKEKED